jgi:hypothetical protein
MKIKSLISNNIFKVAFCERAKFSIKIRARIEVIDTWAFPYKRSTDRVAMYAVVNLWRVYFSITLTPYMVLNERVERWLINRGWY